MSQSTFHPRAHAEVLRSVFDLSGRKMGRTLAKRILELNFQERDAERIEALNAKANDGLLNADEQAELEAYVNVGDLLAFWQSKARQALNTHS